MTIEDFDETTDMFENLHQPKPKSSETLYVISCIFSPFGQDIRTKLAQEFVERIEKEKEDGSPLQICIVELLYPKQESFIKIKDMKYYMQISYEQHGFYLFNKENLINIAVRKLLPSNWKYMAWVDADIEFKNSFWASEAIEQLKSSKCDILHLFSICRFLDSEGLPSRYYHSAVKIHNDKHLRKYGHPGYAWAMKRKAYEQLRGLFEFAIVGGGDSIMCLCLLKQMNTMKKLFGGNPYFYKEIELFRQKAKGLKTQFLDIMIEHNYHGETANRLYKDRRAILIDSFYHPQRDLIRPFPELPLLIPTDDFYRKISKDIEHYFHSRKEVLNENT